ncbi:MAG: metallopeptidase TldD-related protein [Alphaproteobacteria bacterium]|nr:metallopeptidase TldD-related protein [Alphaproteobacteria bacterium]
MADTAPDPQAIVADLIARAAKAGADAADALYFSSAALSHAQRLGEIEKLERAESTDLGLRVFVGQRQAIVSTTDRSPAAIAELAERAIAMARAVPEDPHAGLAPSELIAKGLPDLDLVDEVEPSPEALIELAREAEDAARAVKGITNSEGAEASWSRVDIALAASNGFAGAYAFSRHGIGVSVLAGEGTKMERDYDWGSAVHASDLRSAGEIGKEAGERAVKRLNPRKVESAKLPIIFERRVSGGILGHLTSAISGAAVARGTSFLKDRLGTAIFSKNITVIDDPHRVRGLRSKPFDGEGVGGEKRAIIDKGVLTTWLLDMRSANQLGMTTTGHASRGTSGPPSPSATNLIMQPGEISAEALIGDIKQGLYVNELIGFGVNQVTGDYSRGAGGFWIENGALAYPVSEVTIAGNLVEMFAAITPANDLEIRYGVDAPTLRIDGMTVAGS